MLTSFYIENFRLFKKLHIQALGRVNLIVGRNNSGKSALLEAIEVYASNASTSILVDLIARRQELWVNQMRTPPQQMTLNPIRHLFYNHQFPGFGDGITLGPIAPQSEQLKVQIGAYRVQEDQEGTVRRIPVSQMSTIEDMPDLELSLIVIDKGKARRVLRLDRDPFTEVSEATRLFPHAPRGVTQVVLTRSMIEEKTADLWDAISLTGLDREVISGLQILAPGITDIAFVDNQVFRDRQSGDRRLPLVKMNNQQEPLPLCSMGDGMLRLFHIIVALVNARDGFLLIDEFENGLHWSIQPKVWDILFRLSERLNVQVFASTHSRDCISGFETAWKNRDDIGCFFRLNTDMNVPTTITKYTHEMLSDALETSVEVR